MGQKITRFYVSWAKPRSGPQNAVAEAKETHERIRTLKCLSTLLGRVTNLERSLDPSETSACTQQQQPKSC